MYESDSLEVGEGETTMRRICRPDEASSLSYDEVIGVALRNVNRGERENWRCSLDRTVDESLEGDMGVCVAERVEKVAVPKSGERGGPDEGGMLE